MIILSTFINLSYPGLSEKKLKTGIFDGRQIRKKKNEKQFA